MIADFTLSAVPLRGPLAPIAALLSDGDGVLVRHADSGSWGRIGDPPSLTPRQPREGWAWVDVGWCWLHAPLSRLDSVDLVTSPGARAAVVTWLEEQGYPAVDWSDETLLISLRHAYGLPPAPPSVDAYDDDDIPF